MSELLNQIERAKKEYQEQLKNNKSGYIVKPDLFIYYKVCDYNNLDTPKKAQDYLLKAIDQAKDKEELNAIFELSRTHINLCDTLLKEHNKNV